MNAVVISVEALGKKYRIGTPSGTDRLSETLMNLGRAMMSAPGNWARRIKSRVAAGASPAGHAPKCGEFWALHDVSFEVKEGETVGIIGRNGAGKSTLLKVLSRITAPTTGRFGVRGRVASLLEVGTGFHGELTGRENIFLSGTVLGMSRGEILKRFDEIVAFAEVDQFLDTPVKRYSSGMLMRLGFAVTAHLQADILIVDEVLAVGDAAFQKKCLGKMDEVARGGRTILFVSHSMQAVRSLCTRGVLLNAGRVAHEGPIAAVLSAYTQQQAQTLSVDGVNLRNRLDRGRGNALFERVRVQDARGEARHEFDRGEAVRIECDICVHRDAPSLGFILLVLAGNGREQLAGIRKTVSRSPVAAGATYSLAVDVPNLSFRPGEYGLYLWLGDGEFGSPYDVIDENVSLPVLVVRPDDADPESAGAGYIPLAGAVTVR
jgi:lipopolysaccharide transport system ATP-binding protein